MFMMNNPLLPNPPSLSHFTISEESLKLSTKPDFITLNSFIMESSKKQNYQLTRSLTEKQLFSRIKPKIFGVRNFLKNLSDDTFISGYDITKEKELKMLIDILKMSREQKGLNDIIKIRKSFEKLSFFEEVKIGLDFNDYQQLFRELKYEKFEKFDVIFNIDDMAKKMYIILNGEISVMIPKKIQNLNQITNNEKEPIKTKQEKEKEKEEKKDDLNSLFPNYCVINTLKQGDVFGDIALKSQTTRTATAVCNTFCQFATLSSAVFNTFLKRFYEKKNSEKIEQLKKVSFLKNIPFQFIQAILIHCIDKQIKKGDILIKEGTKINNIYFILDGEIEISKIISIETIIKKFKNKYCDSQKKLKKIAEVQEMNLLKDLNTVWDKKFKKETHKSEKLKTLGIGQYFGEEGLISKKNNYEYTAKCYSATAKLYCIPLIKFLENMEYLETIQTIKNISKTRINVQKKTINEFSNVLSQTMDDLSSILVKNQDFNTENFEMISNKNSIKREFFKGFKGHEPAYNCIRTKNKQEDVKVSLEKAKYHYTTRYLPINLMIKKNIDKEKEEFFEFDLNKNLVKLFNPEIFNSPKNYLVNCNNVSVKKDADKYLRNSYYSLNYENSLYKRLNLENILSKNKPLKMQKKKKIIGKNLSKNNEEKRLFKKISKNKTQEIIKKEDELYNFYIPK